MQNSAMAVMSNDTINGNKKGGAVKLDMAVMSNDTINGKNKVKEEEPEVEPKVEPEVGVPIEELRAKYKETHPEGKQVSPRYINDKEWIQGKINEFTK